MPQQKMPEQPRRPNYALIYAKETSRQVLKLLLSGPELNFASTTRSSHQSTLLFGGQTMQPLPLITVRRLFLGFRCTSGPHAGMRRKAPKINGAISGGSYNLRLSQNSAVLS